MNNKIVLKYDSYITILFEGDEKLVNELYNYFPGCISKELSKDVDYIVRLKETTNDMSKLICNNIDECKIMYPFKNSDYYVYENVAYVVNNEYGAYHKIEKHDNIFDVTCYDMCYEKLFVRIARELIIQRLLFLGFLPIHGSATVEFGYAKIYFGFSGAGKSTLFFHDILNNKFKPLSNDIVFVKNRNKYIEVVSIPYATSIDEKMLDKMIISNDNIKLDTKTKGKEKIKFNLKDFEKIFSVTWKYKAKCKELYYISYKENDLGFNVDEDVDTKIFNEINISEKFSFDDFLNVNNKNNLSFDYTFLRKYVKRVEGNIIRYFEELKGNQDMHIHIKDGVYSYEMLKMYVDELKKREIHKCVFLEHGMRISPKHKARLKNKNDVYMLKKNISQANLENPNVLIYNGIEIDYSKDKLFRKNTIDYLNVNNFDVVIGSLHSMGNLSDKEYLENAVEMVKAYPINIVGHLRVGNVIENSELIEQILEECFKKNIKIEINTSDRSRWDNIQLKNMIEMLRKYNVGYVIASDAHKPEEIGYKIKEIFKNI